MNLCILIPCFNNFEGLIRSIESIEFDGNSFTVLVIDDGSNKAFSAEDIQKDLSKSVQLKVIRIEKNLGITKALNQGLDFIYSVLTVDYVARLDCGDVCTTDRFNKQVAYFELHPQVHLIGSWCYFIDTKLQTAYKYVTPTSHKGILNSMNFRNVFIHPTVMWRISGTGKIYYPDQYPHAEDYAMFYGLLEKHESAIIGEFFVLCEINEAGISISKRRMQLRSRMKVISHYSKKKLLLIMGIVKLYLLLLAPYKVVFFLKKNLYKAS